MNYKVLKDSKIADENWKTKPTKAGNMVQIKNESYAKDLIESGIIEPVENKLATRLFETQESLSNDDFLRIGGIGPATNEKLKKAGYNTFEDLSSADPKVLSKQLGVAEHFSSKVISECMRIMQA